MEYELYEEDDFFNRKRKSKFQKRYVHVNLTQKEVIELLIKCGLSIRKTIRVCDKVFHFKPSYPYVMNLKREMKKRNMIERGVRNFPVWKEEIEELAYRNTGRSPDNSLR